MLSAREEKHLRGLQRRKIREEQGQFLAEGIRVVEDLLASPVSTRWVVVASSLEDSERGRALIDQVDQRGIPRRSLPDPDFARLASTESPQGVLAVAEIPRTSLSELLNAHSPAVLLVLDAIQDPGNLGTLVRSAEALGAIGVLALPGTVDAWNPKAVRSAMGSSFRLPIAHAAWEEASGALRAAGFRLLGASAGGAAIPRGLPRVAVVVGNEGAGLSPEVEAGVDQVVGIPLRGRAESLNVAAAATILLYELTR